jgi:hypothetical protein
MKYREGGAKVLKPETWLNLHFDFNKSSVISWLYRDISFTTATQALDEDQSFSYFLFPINVISESLATPSCSGAVIILR